MKQFVTFPVIGLGAILSTSVLAADLPSKKAPPSPVAAVMPYNWNGGYGGFVGGYGSGSYTKNGSTSFDDASGGSLGVTAGYNYQMPNNYVVGIEGDISWSNMKGDGVISGKKSELESFGTLRGRLGYAMDRVLPFVTAGYAGGNTKDTVTTSSTSYHNGWTVGGGAEFAITGNWTAKVEGLYVHLEPASLPTTGESGMDIGLARAGLNYRF